MIKCIIIDDEKLAREIIKNFLGAFEEIEILDECSNGFDGIKSIQQNKPDFIFLDIQMPKLNGFEMLELLEDPPEIIFSTAYDQYALKAFELNAIDYLLKPFSEERFEQTVKKIMEKLAQNRSEENAAKKISNADVYLEEKLERIVVKQNSKVHVIPVSSINFLEANDDYVAIKCSEGNFLKNKTMKFYEDHLDSNKFIRTHRSYIVNIDFIKEIESIAKESYQILGKDGTKLPVSKSGYSSLKSIFN
ncbi:MAG: LytTR family transcriptional regulator DNA-binding domain-containing protein [Melioribacteraceae bacterium]|nr:LytTR family transcriptional regulator DNA-binding domain-containing protein [Melioribacteraceae bacterium]